MTPKDKRSATIAFTTTAADVAAGKFTSVVELLGRDWRRYYTCSDTFDERVAQEIRTKTKMRDETWTLVHVLAANQNLVENEPIVYSLTTAKSNVDACVVAKNAAGEEFVVARWITGGLTPPNASAINDIVYARGQLWSWRRSFVYCLIGGMLTWFIAVLLFAKVAGSTPVPVLVWLPTAVIVLLLSLVSGAVVRHQRYLTIVGRLKDANLGYYWWALKPV